jgi:phosphosulfolactate synthase
MGASFLDVPERTSKPRRSGVTSLLDGGVSLGTFRDVVESFHAFIDYIKLGWCTAALTPHLNEKIAIARSHDIECYFGGTLFEKALLQNKLSEFRHFCRNVGCDHVEISNGTIDLNNRQKGDHIRVFAENFHVFSEVGYKDPERSIKLHPAAWIAFAREDLTAGAEYVTMEARESGRSGICRPNGELRYGLIQEIILSDLDNERLIFEAPNKTLQAYFIKELGANVNLANIDFAQVLALETLRTGLRSDTLTLFEEAQS